ncbi:MAG: hypothetical protein JAY64_01725 [Candidatus Thiodiazotropha weberae]|nr:hypothetical protein [Candidatus Thiodiazotropha lotti]MCG8010409.1 hypothetical protein [Candidatus Thiodiazotropha lotti]MCW4209868.1 hypothetical protein [Candidatus Thiodiazotropha lotti]MCW4214553.1 hypothetical protein [Candidatus Thiodiazotropha lotti]
MFDLIGTRSLASKGLGSYQMIQMHQSAVTKINHGLPLHAHGYVWNDSALLLSYETKPAARRSKVLAELNEFKTWLEIQCEAKLYAISVKGMSFPSNELGSSVFEDQTHHQPRAVVLKASSWAMANCFEIEKSLSKHRADWYIDERITNGINLGVPFAQEKVSLLPKKIKRTIHMFKGELTINE